MPKPTPTPQTPEMPEGMSFLHFSSWCARCRPGVVSDRLQELTAQLDRERCEPDTYEITEEGDLLLRWEESGFSTTARVTLAGVVWGHSAAPDTEVTTTDSTVPSLILHGPMRAASKERERRRAEKLKDDPFSRGHHKIGGTP